MDHSDEEVELTEEVVLELGNQILAVLGADEPITDLEPFTTDALYIQLFKALFPHLPLDELEPGNDEEEVLDNLRTLRGILGESILETDLSYISASAIRNGDLSHLSEFLQILMQVIALLAEGEGEGDEDPSGRKSNQSPEDFKLDMEGEDYDEEEEDEKTDTQKIKDGLGLSSPGDDRDDEEDLDEQMLHQMQDRATDSDLDPTNPDVPVIQDEPLDGSKGYSPEPEESEKPNFDSDMKRDSSKKKEVIDVLNDPLLPADVDMRHSSGKKRKHGSFSDRGHRDAFNDDEEEDDEDGVAFDDLNPEDKMAVLQQLYEEYQKDPDSFPEDQRILLEEEIKNMIENGQIEGFDDEGEESEEDERMMVKGEINFPQEPLPIQKEDEIKEIDAGDDNEDIDVEEVDMKRQSDLDQEESDQDEQQQYENQLSGQYNNQYGEPDEEAEIIEEEEIVEETTEIIEEFPQNHGNETPDIDENTKMALLQRMQQEQEAISRRIIRRKKSKKKKKITRPSTAKYTHGMMSKSSKYVRPSTAGPKRKKKKTKKRKPEDVYFEQLRQQQMLQQLALEQQQRQQQMEDEDGEIQITPEQAMLLYQQLVERYQSGEELSQEELEQLQSLQMLLQQNMAQEQLEVLDVDEPVHSYPVRKTVKRRKSKTKGKRKLKKTRQQQIDENALLMMIQNQQNMQYQQPNIGLPEGVDEIQEVDEEDTPIREQREMEDAKRQEQYYADQYQPQSNTRVHETDIPTQLNAQVPANFGFDSEESKTPLAYYPQQYLNPEYEENMPGNHNLSPEQLYQLQQMNAQGMYPDDASSEVSSKYAKDPSQNIELIKYILDLGARGGVFKKNLLSILPLSDSVANAKRQYSTMKKYKVDAYDKKFQSELAQAANAKDSKEYFLQVFKKIMENIKEPYNLGGARKPSRAGSAGGDSNKLNINNFSKFCMPLLKYCKKNGLKSFEDLFMEDLDQQFKEKVKTMKFDSSTAKKKKNSKVNNPEKIKSMKFSEEIMNKQKSRVLKRDALQTKINRRLQTLANRLEKEKIIAEKVQLKEFNHKLAMDKKDMIEKFTKYWDDQMNLVKEQIEEEKMAKRIVEVAENQSLSDWKKELNRKENKKLTKLLNVFDQQDEKYEVENLNLEKMEEQLIKMYKRN